MAGVPLKFFSAESLSCAGEKMWEKVLTGQYPSE
jgi:hypothetical protein